MDEFRLLGPLEAVVDGNPVQLAAAKPRAVLAFLLLHRNRVVSTERLIDELWADEPPARATKTLQVYISQLRKALGPDRLRTQPPGYVLRVDTGELDLERFEELLAEGRRQLGEGDAPAARGKLREALDLWRGPPEPVAAQLEELRLAAHEDWLHAAVDSGQAAAAIPDLERLIKAEPLRERPRGLLMLALYRAGRQADALDLFRRTRELFVNELGIEPGPELRELEGAMLRQEPELRLTPSAPSVPPPARKQRRWWVLAATIAAVVAALVAVLAFRDGESKPTPKRANPELEAFVVKVENLLAQSHDGRVAVGRAFAGAFDCSLSPQVAAAQLDGVQQNRQSLLDQLAALRVPTGRAALRSSDLLQRAIHASIAADWIYRDWLRARTKCARGQKLPVAGRRLDAKATRLKQKFVAAFDPLASRFDKRLWQANQF